MAFAIYLWNMLERRETLPIYSKVKENNNFNYVEFLINFETESNTNFQQYINNVAWRIIRLYKINLLEIIQVYWPASKGEDEETEEFCSNINCIVDKWHQFEEHF